MLVSFIIGVVNALLVISLWTKKFMPGGEEPNGVKYVVYTLGIAIPLNILVETLIRSW